MGHAIGVERHTAGRCHHSRSSEYAWRRRKAIALAELADKWDAHPSRAEQTIAWVRGVEHMWPECHVPLNACVIRFWNKKKKQLDHIVLVTTDLELSASWIVRHYEERPEIEQDYEQMKSGGWQLQKLSSTRYSEIVFYVLTVVLSYSLYHLFANTQAGRRFADKTRQAIAFEQLRNHTRSVSCTGGLIVRPLYKAHVSKISKCSQHTR